MRGEKLSFWKIKNLQIEFEATGKLCDDMVLYFLTKEIAMKSEKNVITNSKAEVILSERYDTVLF